MSSEPWVFTTAGYKPQPGILDPSKTVHTVTVTFNRAPEPGELSTFLKGAHDALNGAARAEAAIALADAVMAHQPRLLLDSRCFGCDRLWDSRLFDVTADYWHESDCPLVAYRTSRAAEDVTPGPTEGE